MMKQQPKVMTILYDTRINMPQHRQVAGPVALSQASQEARCGCADPPCHHELALQPVGCCCT